MGVSFIGKWLTMADRFPKVLQSCDVPPVQLLAVCIIGILFLKSPLMTISRVWKSKNIQEAYLAICNELFHDMSFFFSNMPPNCNQIMSISSFSHHFPTIFPAFPHKKWPFLAARRAVPCGSRSTWCPLRGAEAWTKGCALTPLTPQIHRWIYKKWIHVIYADTVFLNIWLVVWTF